MLKKERMSYISVRRTKAQQNYEFVQKHKIMEKWPSILLTSKPGKCSTIAIKKLGATLFRVTEFFFS